MFLLLTVSLLKILFPVNITIFLTYRGLSYYYYYLCSLTRTQQHSLIWIKKTINSLKPIEIRLHRKRSLTDIPSNECTTIMPLCQTKFDTANTFIVIFIKIISLFFFLFHAQNEKLTNCTSSRSNWSSFLNQQRNKSIDSLKYILILVNRT